MNEEQSESLLQVLREIRDLLKPRQEIKTTLIQRSILPSSIQSLVDFKDFVTSDEFYNTLSDKQKRLLTKRETKR